MEAARRSSRKKPAKSAGEYVNTEEAVVSPTAAVAVPTAPTTGAVTLPTAGELTQDERELMALMHYPSQAQTIDLPDLCRLEFEQDLRRARRRRRRFVRERRQQLQRDRAKSVQEMRQFVEQQRRARRQMEAWSHTNTECFIARDDAALHTSELVDDLGTSPPRAPSVGSLVRIFAAVPAETFSRKASETRSQQKERIVAALSVSRHAFVLARDEHRLLLEFASDRDMRTVLDSVTVPSHDIAHGMAMSLDTVCPAAHRPHAWVDLRQHVLHECRQVVFAPRSNVDDSLWPAQVVALWDRGVRVPTQGKYAGCVCVGFFGDNRQIRNWKPSGTVRAFDALAAARSGGRYAPPSSTTHSSQHALRLASQQRAAWTHRRRRCLLLHHLIACEKARRTLCKDWQQCQKEADPLDAMLRILDARGGVSLLLPQTPSASGDVAFSFLRGQVVDADSRSFFVRADSDNRNYRVNLLHSCAKSWLAQLGIREDSYLDSHFDKSDEEQQSEDDDDGVPRVMFHFGKVTVTLPPLLKPSPAAAAPRPPSLLAAETAPALDWRHRALVQHTDSSDTCWLCRLPVGSDEDKDVPCLRCVQCHTRCHASCQDPFEFDPSNNRAEELRAKLRRYEEDDVDRHEDRDSGNDGIVELLRSKSARDPSRAVHPQIRCPKCTKCALCQQHRHAGTLTGGKVCNVQDVHRHPRRQGRLPAAGVRRVPPARASVVSTAAAVTRGCTCHQAVRVHAVSSVSRLRCHTEQHV
ncbi:MAG: hypothetical protein MHM6MM_005058, partial [Cercozoa sp. M6MM]